MEPTIEYLRALDAMGRRFHSFAELFPAIRALSANDGKRKLDPAFADAGQKEAILKFLMGELRFSQLRLCRLTLCFFW